MRHFATTFTLVLSLTSVYLLWHPLPQSPPFPAPVAAGERAEEEVAPRGDEEVARVTSPRGGNQRIANFSQAKKIAEGIYRDMATTFYCGCSYSGHLIDHRSCGYIPQREEERAYRLEWEHVVPAAAFGRKITAWIAGDPRCRTSKGKAFRGRRCARLVSAQFRQMEADLYNLVPEIGEMNQQRGILPFVEEEPADGAHFGTCHTIIGRRGVQPREEIRGFIARTYRYMNAAYPGFGLVNSKNAAVIKEWGEKYPATLAERTRGRRIAVAQGNRNPFLGETSTIRRVKP